LYDKRDQKLSNSEKIKKDEIKIPSLELDQNNLFSLEKKNFKRESLLKNYDENDLKLENVNLVDDEEIQINFQNK
jgi:hypothetical protein